MRLGTRFLCALPKGMACPLRKCRSTAIGCSFPGRTATQSAVMECYYQLLRRYRDSICMVDALCGKKAWAGAGISSVIKLSKTVAISEQTRSYWIKILWHSVTVIPQQNQMKIPPLRSVGLLVLQEKDGEWNVAHHLLQRMVITGLRHKGGTWPDQFSMAAFFGCPDSWLTSVFKCIWRYKKWAFKFGDVPKAVY